MTRDISTSDSSIVVDPSWLIPTIEPGDNPANPGPVSQTITDIVRALWTQAFEDKLNGIDAGAEVNLTGSALQAAIDTATGGTIWRSAHTVLRTAIQTRDLLDGLLGTGWRTSGGGGTSGISLDQAIDGVGAALAALAEFSYDSAANTFTFTIQANSVTAAQARADSAAHQAEWRNRIQAARLGAVNTRTANYTVTADDIGRSVRLTGSIARTFTLPDITGNVPVGSIIFFINDSTAPLTLDGNGADTVDGAATLVVVPGEAVEIQAVTSTAWSLLSDTTSGEATVWADIPIGTPIRLGQVVTHGSAFFGCITAHNRSGTGPDGDAANWVQISNWRGAWQNVWYPVGSFVIHAGLPWVAIQAVVRGDPAPNATNNVKWLILGAIPPSVVIASSNTAIPSSADGDTYIHTGSADITYTLPAASGGGAVRDGWQVVVSNQGAGDLTIDGNGSDTIDGQASLVITDNGRSVQLQKIANTVWITIADTKDDTSSGENLPTVVNVSADTAIPATAHGDTYRVTGNTARTITLPDPDDLSVGFFVRVANGSAAGTNHSVARQGVGQSIEGGNGPLAVPSGEVVTLQLVNANEWELIADTGKAAAMASMASGDSRALPIHAANVALANTNFVDAGFDWPENIPYLLVQWNPSGRRNHGSFSVIYNPRLGRYPGDATGITNAAVGDAPGASNSIGYAVPFAISAGREVEAAQASFGKTAANRALVACSDAAQDPTPLVVLAIVPSDTAGTARSTVLQSPVPGADGAGVSSITLPADYATYKTLSLVMWDHSGNRINSSDYPVALLAAQTAEVHLALGFVADIDWNPTTRQIDHTEDRILYAELHDGGASAGLDQDARDAAAGAQTAAVAAREIADANAAVIGRLSVFENYDLNPGGISGRDFPEFMALTLSTKLVDKIITRLRVSISGQIVANVQLPADLAPFNNSLSFISGGVVNLTLNAAARLNLKNNLGTAPQFIEVSVDYTFDDETTANDRLHFGTNNNAFDLGRNPYFSSNARTVAAATPGPALTITNIASYDATQNRFEDSSGNEVVVPSGAIAFVTDAAYAAAVADSGFTPNPTAFFFTPTAIHFGGLRYGRQRERFETAVGASPAVLPVGTHEISVKGAASTQNGHARVLLSEIPAADDDITIRLKGGNSVEFVWRYAPATRTLTYAAPVSGTVTSITAIGLA